jgi:hypothetical protein
MKFEKKQDYRKHFIEQHKKKEKDLHCFKCTECNKVYRTKTGLDNHKCHVCPTCGKKFPSKQNLTNHMTVHSDERPFKCEFCQKAYKTKTSLINHNKTTHARKEKHKCQCGEAFGNSFDFMVHNRTCKYYQRSKKVYEHSCCNCRSKFYHDCEWHEHLLVCNQRRDKWKEYSDRNKYPTMRVALLRDKNIRVVDDEVEINGHRTFIINGGQRLDPCDRSYGGNKYAKDKLNEALNTDCFLVRHEFNIPKTILDMMTNNKPIMHYFNLTTPFISDGSFVSTFERNCTALAILGKDVPMVPHHPTNYRHIMREYSEFFYPTFLIVKIKKINECFVLQVIDWCYVHTYDDWVKFSEDGYKKQLRMIEEEEEKEMEAWMKINEEKMRKEREEIRKTLTPDKITMTVTRSK